MTVYEIEGGARLSGTVTVSGAKNAVLPLLAASLLFDKRVTLRNVPQVRDTFTMIKLLRLLGTKIGWREEHILEASTPKMESILAPYEIVSQMRASIYVLGPILVREGKARVSLPGGCAFGPRPVNFHIDGLKKMGASIHIDHGYIVATHNGLHGCEITFDKPSVGATAHLMMVASAINDRTVITNAAKEPEVIALANFLAMAGAKIKGAGTDTVIIEGNENLSPPSIFEVPPDRIEAGTFAVASAITGGDVLIKGLVASYFQNVISKLIDSGTKVEVLENGVRIFGAPGRPHPLEIETSPYPGFPTDMQAQFMAYLSVSSGTSVISEGIYPDRFKHAFELMRMGADIKVEGNTAVVKGVSKLYGAPVMGSDLRAAVALVLAGLRAEGKTIVHRIYHLERGYENFCRKLQSLGAKISVKKI